MWVSSISDDLHRCASPRWGSIRWDTRTGSCRMCWHSFPPDTGRAAPGIRLCLMWDRERERERVITLNPPGFIPLPAARSTLTLQDDRDGVRPEAFSSGTQGFVLGCEETEFIRAFAHVCSRHKDFVWGFPLSCVFKWFI